MYVETGSAVPTAADSPPPESLDNVRPLLQPGGAIGSNIMVNLRQTDAQGRPPAEHVHAGGRGSISSRYCYFDRIGEP